MPVQSIDLFTNKALAGLTMTAADALTFEQLRFATGIFEGVGIVIHKLAYYPSHADVIQLVAATDYLQMGLTARDDITSLLPTNQNVIDQIQVETVIVGTVVGINHLIMPIVTDFTQMPGGGMIVPANPIFFAMDSGGFATAGVGRLVMYYTFKKLADKDYLELLQTMVPANI